MGIRRKADLIINNHPICESAGCAVVSVTEYIGVPQRHLQCIKLHVTLQRLCNKADAGLWPLLWWPAGLVIHFVLRIQAFICLMAAEKTKLGQNTSSMVQTGVCWLVLACHVPVDVHWCSQIAFSRYYRWGLAGKAGCVN